MKSEFKILVIITVVSLIILIGGVFFLSKGSKNSSITGQAVEIDYSKGQKIGSDSAKVKLVEFSDFQCPACRAAYPFVAEIIKQPDVQLIYMHYPLPQHKNAAKAAVYSEIAASQGKFKEYHDLLFETQDEWFELDNPDEYFRGLAKRINLDENKIEQALQSSEYAKKVEESLVVGRSLGVNSTPTFYINNRLIKLTNFADLEAEILKSSIKR